MKILNRQALHNYKILDRFEAGINLLGSEVKSVKAGHINLTGAFARIIGSEAYLVNASIPLYEYARPEGYDERRTRKLLLHKKEIIALKTKMAQGNWTLVPLACYSKGSLIKLELALAQGKKEYDHREEIKKRDLTREVEITLRGKM